MATAQQESRGFGGSPSRRRSLEKKLLLGGVLDSPIRRQSEIQFARLARNSTFNECLIRIAQIEFAARLFSSQRFRPLCFVNSVFSPQHVSLRIRIASN